MSTSAALPDWQSLLLSSAPTILAPVPEGYEPWLLADLAVKNAGKVILHVCRSDARLQATRELLTAIAPHLAVLAFPAWDCLPYDRVSPNPDIVAERLATLAALQERTASTPCIVLTTANAIGQRVPAPVFLGKGRLKLEKGQKVSTARLRQALSHNGYQAVATVREPGEFAIRGDLADIFPPGQANPVRVERFGDTIETLKAFDPLSQRSGETLDRVSLEPAREILLTDDTIQRFRLAYRSLVQKAGMENDPLFAAITAGHYYPGMEHWLPLFHETLVPITDWTGETVTTFESEAFASLDSRYAQVQDYYQQRQSLSRSDQYYPVPPESLYMSPAELEDVMPQRLVFQPFATPQAATTLPIGRSPDFTAIRAQTSLNLYTEVTTAIRALWKEKHRVILAAYSVGSRDRLAGLFRAEGNDLLVVTADTWQEALSRQGKVLVVTTLPLEHGFRDDATRLTVITEQDILGEKLVRKTRKRKADAFIREASALTVGDYVVHTEHGIGQYDGLETLQIVGERHDCVRILYSGGDKLYVPVENIDVLSRFASEDSENVTLDKLGGVAWQQRKARVKERIRAIAGKLLETAAARALKTGEVLAADSGWYDEFVARFPWPETDDQLNAISDVLEDLSSGKPMDRLVCGDVGFGKTEVAMRAAFVAALSGKQVALVVPTTLLAAQHYKGFVKRFEGFPLRLATLSRMVSPKEAARVRDALEQGEVDIVIGTHALLAKTIKFKNLGLVIVDEEQHFGVAQKEKLKELQTDVHLLTLSATPIPRTLQMALSGVRDMSLIATPPVDRLAIRTFVLPFDSMVIREALMREHARGGQSFYVVPRIKDLEDIREKLATLVPEVKVAVAHGQLAAGKLEDIMGQFLGGEVDVLLSTQIIESGIDIPTANTMIVHNAHLFGLAQLYQLRGRIGRGRIRGYAYLTTPADRTLPKTSMKRLEVMQTLDHLGAGFTLASHDMDIRGAGNLLGDEQSGHIREVGVELYQQMLEDAVKQAQKAASQQAGALGADDMEEDWSPVIQLSLPVLIPESYVPDLDTRMALYKRAASLRDSTDIEGFAAELIDRFGALPKEVENLLAVVALKAPCRRAHIARIDVGPKGVVVAFHQNTFPKPEALLAYIQKAGNTIKLRPDQKLVFLRAFATPQKMLEGVGRIIGELGALV